MNIKELEEFLDKVANCENENQVENVMIAYQYSIIEWLNRLMDWEENNNGNN